MNQRDWEQHQEFERAGTREAQERNWEAEAQAGNQHFQIRHAPDWVQAQDETAWAWNASADWRREAEKAETPEQRDRLIALAERVYWH